MEQKEFLDRTYQIDCRLENNNIKPSNNIKFYCGEKEMLRLESSGDIYVKEKLIENDKDVVEGLRDFLRCHKYCI